MRIDVDRNHGQVAESIENYYGGGVSLPPDGHPNSRYCPQCEQATWRMTQHCVCCGVDLFAMDEHHRWRAIQRRKTKFAVFFGLFAALAIYGKDFLPETMQGIAVGMGVVAGIVALAAVKD